ncbi:MAG TPA: hypothetical protein VKT70_11985, partial [Stellaceae bacterium]|nr:hypothetical protein [Stellaceae bacterium]
MAGASERLVKLFCCLVALLGLAGCSVNDLLMVPSEARELQRKDPIDPVDYGDTPEAVDVRNGGGYRLTGWLFTEKDDYGTVMVLGGN